MLLHEVFEALRTLDTGRIMEGARVYGGGPHKVEPKELASLPADFLVEAMDGGMPPETPSNGGSLDADGSRRLQTSVDSNLA
jgi:hypothetical protein